MIVLVFDKQLSIFAPVLLSFASSRSVSVGGSASVSNKYDFELTAKRGQLRRLYRHFLLGKFIIIVNDITEAPVIKMYDFGITRGLPCV